MGHTRCELAAAALDIARPPCCLAEQRSTLPRCSAHRRCSSEGLDCPGCCRRAEPCTCTQVVCTVPPSPHQLAPASHAHQRSRGTTLGRDGCAPLGHTRCELAAAALDMARLTHTAPPPPCCLAAAGLACPNPTHCPPATAAAPPPPLLRSDRVTPPQPPPPAVTPQRSVREGRVSCAGGALRTSTRAAGLAQLQVVSGGGLTVILDGEEAHVSTRRVKCVAHRLYAPAPVPTTLTLRVNTCS